MENYNLYDLVKVKKNQKGERYLEAVTLCRCSGCNGYTGFYHKGENHTSSKAKRFACFVSLIQAGRSSISYDNSFYEPKECDCDKWKNRKIPVPVIDDTGWKLNERTSNPIRGINDYDRIITFKRKPDPAELLVIKEILKRQDCPGWTGIQVGPWIENRETKHIQIKFSTTWDSSD